ncbi:TetR/AcrR family transcriptional regulator [Nonomuraea sp. LPB2021202275-12-8]|uniref:TetR/AcrR family transcriptional regulator n=1 Tax=Nonomuraea sp. LPB2021202275-12-8 TaxID=3120159 RepID=UPI00300CA673
MNTAERLVSAAAELLDAGGEAAVTLRAVAAAVGVSHNAPYKHFTSRDALLAEVAVADFTALTDNWAQIRTSPEKPAERLLSALDVLIRFSQDRPAHYHLLFASPEIAAQGGRLTDAANSALGAFSDIVEDCQAGAVLPASPGNTLAVVLFAATHGLIAAAASGRLRSESGIDTRSGMEFLIGLLHGR